MASNSGSATAGAGSSHMNTTAVVSQWDRCMEISKDRNDLKQAFENLTLDEQLAYCSVGSNVKPVIQDLERIRNEKISRIQKLTDDISAYYMAKEASEKRVDAHALFHQTAGDRSKIEQAKQIHEDVMVMVRSKCSGDAELTGKSSTRASLHFPPVPGTSSAVTFKQLIAEPTINDGEYTTEEIDIVIAELVKDLQKTKTLAQSHNSEVEELRQQLDDARKIAQERDRTIQSYIKTQGDNTKNIEQQLEQIHDLRTQLDDLRNDHLDQLDIVEQKIDTLEQEKMDVSAQLDMTKMNLDNANKNLEMVNENLKSARQAVQNESPSAAKDDCTSGQNDSRIANLEGKYIEKEEETARLERELTELARKLNEEQENFETKLQRKLSEREQELRAEWTVKLRSETAELQQERDKLEQDALQNATALRQSNAAWSKTLTVVLASTLTSEDIPSDLLHLVLPRPFSSIQNFSCRPVESYVFADNYTGLGTDVSQIIKGNLRMVEVLSWINGVSSPSDIPEDFLERTIWLEKHLLEDIRIHNKSDSWVLLAFSLLSNMVVSDCWPGCCIAAVRLAVLSRQYPLHDKPVWDAFVAGLMNRYTQLDMDPLGQACLAYLCLTTSDPAAMMTQNLPTALSQGRFDTSVRIPELVAILDESQDVASARDNGSLSVVVVRRQHKEVIFSRPRDSVDWTFSLQPVELSYLPNLTRRMKWGSRPGQSIDIYGQSAIWFYCNRHYGMSMAKVKQGMRESNKNKLARIRQKLI